MQNPIAYIILNQMPCEYKNARYDKRRNAEFKPLPELFHQISYFEVSK